MNNELIERYIYAVSKKLPRKIRTDVERELQTLIADMLDERCGEISPTERDVNVVLAELGKPSELAQQYHPAGSRSLIGPDYYNSYVSLLKIVLGSVTFALLMACVVLLLLEPSKSPIAKTGEWIFIIIQTCTYLFAVITLLFAFFERRGIKFDIADEDISSLPPVPAKEEKISRWEPILGIVGATLITIILLATPQLLGWVNQDGVRISIFDTVSIRSMWYVVLALAAISIVNETVRLLEGQRTKRVLTVTIIADVLSLPLVIWLFNSGFKLNPAFLEGIYDAMGTDTSIPATMLANANNILLGIVVICLIAGIGMNIFHMVKARQAE
ncbi:hypothetical protein LJC42_05785 [Eubacteriales bacterium OttesenSCG-928-K08]|nr:hypothetical protein [Eubacteriales bacterium OttesenSCG-928-K08]